MVRRRVAEDRDLRRLSHAGVYTAWFVGAPPRTAIDMKSPDGARKRHAAALLRT